MLSLKPHINHSFGLKSETVWWEFPKKGGNSEMSLRNTTSFVWPKFRRYETWIWTAKKLHQDPLGRGLKRYRFLVLLPEETEGVQRTRRWERDWGVFDKWKNAPNLLSVTDLSSRLTTRLGDKTLSHIANVVTLKLDGQLHEAGQFKHWI